MSDSICQDILGLSQLSISTDGTLNSDLFSAASDSQSLALLPIPLIIGVALSITFYRLASIGRNCDDTMATDGTVLTLLVLTITLVLIVIENHNLPLTYF